MRQKLTRTILLTAIIAITTFIGVIFTSKIITPSFQITNEINSNLVDDQSVASLKTKYGFMDIKQGCGTQHHALRAAARPPSITLNSRTNNSIVSEDAIIYLNIVDETSEVNQILYHWEEQTNTTLIDPDGDSIYEVILPSGNGTLVLHVYAQDSDGNWSSVIFSFTASDRQQATTSADFPILFVFLTLIGLVKLITLRRSN
ncbi:MAG: hypothetical protein ACXAC8_02815 [Candidatus Hodarchaeales archaeon]|jgi:hypothetical protein